MSKITRYYATLKNTTPIAIVEESHSVFEFLSRLDDITISGTAISGIFRDYLLKRLRYGRNEYSEIEIKNLEIVYVLLFKSIDGLNFEDAQSSNQNIQSKKLFLGLIAETTKNYQPLSFFDMIMSAADTMNKIEGNVKLDDDIYEYRNRVMINRKTSVAIDGGLFKERLIDAGLSFDFAMELKHLCVKSFPSVSEEILKKKLNEKKFLYRYIGTNINDNNDEIFEIKININEHVVVSMYKEFTNNFDVISDCINDYINKFINQIHCGEIHLTGKSNLGYGQFEITELKCRDFKLEKDLDEFLSLESVYDHKKLNKLSITSESKNFEYIKVKCDSGLVIPKDYYKIGQEKEKYEHVLIPSSTIKGIVRSNFERIAATKEKTSIDMIKNGYNDIISSNDINKINNIFGYTNEYFVKQNLRKREEDELSSKKGIIRFYDVKISEFETEETTNVKIDRFTGGAYTGGIKEFKRLILKKDYVIEIKYFVDPYADPLLKECFNEYLDYFLMDIRDGLVSIGSNESTGYGMLTLA